MPETVTPYDPITLEADDHDGGFTLRLGDRDATIALALDRHALDELAEVLGAPDVFGNTARCSATIGGIVDVDADTWFAVSLDPAGALSVQVQAGILSALITLEAPAHLRFVDVVDAARRSDRS